MENRLQRITRASVIGIFLNVALVLIKAVVGVMSNSVSVLADAVNNLMDCLSSIVTLVGVRIARIKPDKEHPHGHGRVEYLAAIMIGLIILGVGVETALTSFPKILSPTIAGYSAVSVVVLSITIISKIVYSKYLKYVGKRTKSKSLMASGVDAMFDAVLTIGTVVGALVSLLFNVSIDGWIGLLIAIFIIRSAVEILGEGFGDIIGRKVDGKIVRQIKAEIREVKGVKKITEIVLHDYGPEDVSGAVKIVVDDEMPAKEFKRIANEIERRLFEELGVQIVVGM